VTELSSRRAHRFTLGPSTGADRAAALESGAELLDAISARTFANEARGRLHAEVPVGPR
jgi:hypothetical protein